MYRLQCAAFSVSCRHTCIPFILFSFLPVHKPFLIFLIFFHDVILILLHTPTTLYNSDSFFLSLALPLLFHAITFFLSLSVCLTLFDAVITGLKWNVCYKCNGYDNSDENTIQTVHTGSSTQNGAKKIKCIAKQVSCKFISKLNVWFFFAVVVVVVIFAWNWWMSVCVGFWFYFSCCRTKCNAMRCYSSLWYIKAFAISLERIRFFQSTVCRSIPSRVSI